jgi:hypothetical protein
VLQWLLGHPEHPLCNAAIDAIGRTPWSSQLWSIPGPEGLAYIGALSMLLSNGWLGESHINAFMEYVNVRSEGKIWAANTTWAVKMWQIRMASAKKLAADVELENLTQIIHNGAHYLLFPANLDNAHWVIFFVNLDTRDFCCGVCTTVVVHN